MVLTARETSGCGCPRLEIPIGKGVRSPTKLPGLYARDLNKWRMNSRIRNTFCWRVLYVGGCRLKIHGRG